MTARNGNGRQVALIADDDPTMRLMMEQMVVQAGLVPLVAADGAEAIALLDDNAPQLLLLDVEMPGLSGYEVCRLFRARDGNGLVPVVMVTAHDDTESVERAYEAGATDFIVKPINWPVFAHRLRYILRNAGTVMALDASKTANKALLQAIPDELYLLGRDGRVLRSLHNAATGAKNVSDLVPPAVAGHALACIEDVLDNSRLRAHEYEIHGDESVRHYETRYIPQSNGQVLAIIRDISERIRAERHIRQLANYDTLTGLPNRALFSERAAAVLAAIDPGHEGLAMLYVDLDRFSRINDTLGHTVGDDVLKSVALRISRLVYGGSDGVGRRELARFGGDEFVIFIRHATPRTEAVALARKIIDALSDSMSHSAHEFQVTPSIGISMYPQHGHDVETLIKNADTAVYRAKAEGRNNLKLYADTMNTRALQRLSLENSLRQAVSQGALEVHYQPKYRADDLSVAGAEALLRWPHPEHGQVSPGVFIPMAEESGLIDEIGRFVVETVCAQIAAWTRSGIDPVSVAVNMSGREFFRGDPAGLLSRAVARHGIDPARLEIEITETVLMHDVDRVERALSSIRALGFGLSIDDFGTGFSSLGYLKRFPIDALKIDRSFVVDLPGNTEDVAICEAVLALARSLGLKVVAEGVETEAQLHWLVDAGCDYLQGFLLSRPLDASGFASLLRGATCLPGIAPASAMASPAPDAIDGPA